MAGRVPSLSVNSSASRKQMSMIIERADSLPRDTARLQDVRGNDGRILSCRSCP
jgi:hypothetical protein